MTRSFRFQLPFLLAALSLLPSPGKTQTQAIDFVPGHTRFDFIIGGATSWAVGYEFTTGRTTPVSVYNLGFYDSGLAPLTPGTVVGNNAAPNGFTASHAVGLYDANTNALLVQAIVPQNSTLLASNFRYASQLLDASGNPITGPYTLGLQGTYYIVGVSNGENFTYVQNSGFDLTHDPNVSYLHSVYQASTTLLVPNLADGASGYFGGNFTTSPFPTAGAPTPEPGPAAFAVCAAFVGLLWHSKRLRRARPANSAS